MNALAKSRKAAEAASGGGNGRDDWIRTSGPLLPKQVRYQTALHPDVFPQTTGETFSTAGKKKQESFGLGSGRSEVVPAGGGERGGGRGRYRGRWNRMAAAKSGECRRLLTEHGSDGLYPRLLQAYARDFNWSYRDRYPELEIIQRSFLFTLYLLQRYGDEERPHAFYEDAFLRAFPRALDEVPSDYFFPADSTVRGCFTLRALVNFAGFFGLATVVPITASIFCKDFRVQKLPLLAAAIRFHLPR